MATGTKKPILRLWGVVFFLASLASGSTAFSSEGTDVAFSEDYSMTYEDAIRANSPKEDTNEAERGLKEEIEYYEVDDSHTVSTQINSRAYQGLIEMNDVEVQFYARRMDDFCFEAPENNPECVYSLDCTFEPTTQSLNCPLSRLMTLDNKRQSIILDLDEEFIITVVIAYNRSITQKLQREVLEKSPILSISKIKNARYAKGGQVASALETPPEPKAP